MTLTIGSLCSGIGGIDVGVEAGCWYREDDHDLPRWWVEPRLRPFTSWDCCSLPSDPWDAAGLYEEMVR